MDSVFNTRGLSHAPDQGEDDDMGNTTPANEDVTITACFLDSAGQEQYAIVRTTVPAASIMNRKADVKLGLNTFFAMAKCQLLSMQISVEHSEILQGVRAQAKLRLVPKSDPPAQN